ncbi:MAG: hypothetical protein U5P41_07505 [Gammaproteobacteria bacterium]|nr:hypothetical protein [Gammaproteobacteria bacterium]
MSGDGTPAGQWQTFADGFTGTDKLMDPGMQPIGPWGRGRESIGSHVWHITYQND